MREDGDPGTILMEDRFPAEVVDELRRQGHGVRLLTPFDSGVGHAHCIRVLEDGTYVGGADPRADSLALGY
jgi:gamma-glutamyltranspeptidase/glutathione hydrolase